MDATLGLTYGQAHAIRDGIDKVAGVAAADNS